MSLTLAMAGCIGPIKTDSKISMNGPVTAHLIAEVPAKSNSNPLVPMTVECGDAARIAIIDVDGLLVNQNGTGPYSQGENPVDLFREKLDKIASDERVCAVVMHSTARAVR